MAFDPAKPDGANASLTSAISPDGAPELGVTYVVPARCGVAVRVAAGRTLVIVNTHGSQVCDFWAFAAEDLGERLSMSHVHTDLRSIYPKVGDRLVSNLRRAMLTLAADTSPGGHDTVVACCDAARYAALGCETYHDNCADNLRMALAAIGLTAPAVPAPFNIWMNTPVDADGAISWRAPTSRPGDAISLRAERDLVAVLSACPMDLSPINGDGPPTELHFRVEA